MITYPGSQDDRDALWALAALDAEAVPVWHDEHDLPDLDAVVVPGGFSYGDYLRCGAIAAHSPIMREVADAAARGVPVLGICNGFQMLTEAHLLPGGLVRNEAGAFVCRDQRLRIESTATVWTAGFEPGEEIVVPLKNGEGGYLADADTVARLEDEGRVVFRYVGTNPNGSVHDIAGVANERGNVVGLMPHPEHAVEPGFGPDTPAAMRSGVDGLRVFRSVLETVLA